MKCPNPLEIWKENVCALYEGKKIGIAEASKIVGGRKRLFSLVENGDIEVYERVHKDNRVSFLYNGRQVIEHICNWRRKINA